MQDIETALAEIRVYRDGPVEHPFFVAVDDDQSYRRLKDETPMQAAAGTILRVSATCPGADVAPDLDAMTSTLRSAPGFKVLIGLGEYLTLLGRAELETQLSHFRDVLLEHGKVVVLCRGCRDALKRLAKEDPRFDSRRLCLLEESDNTLGMTLSPAGLNVGQLDGFRAALLAFEDGVPNVCVETELNFPNATIEVKRINTAYQAIRHLDPTFTVPEECGSSTQWTQLLNELMVHDTLSSVCNQHELTQYRPGTDYAQWLYFVALKARGTDRPYLSLVLDRTSTFAAFDENVLNVLLEVDPKEDNFNRLYEERKALIKNLSEADMAAFATRTKIKDTQRLHYLTDNTEVERKTIIECLATCDEMPLPYLTAHWPAMHHYLRDFAFNCGELSGQVRDYFARYKRQKVLNRLEPECLDRVATIARERQYNLLQTRDEVFDRIVKKQTVLFFVDALGLEFMGFIQARCAELSLRLDATVARANLPSITSMNKAFFENWPGRKVSIRDLDSLKHSGENGFDYQQTKLPIHLARELEIVDSVLERARTELASGDVRRVIIASDHGASRLVVVTGQELQYEVDNKGTHSGRCCAVCHLQGLESAAEENGYLVLADYGRFKGGRAASVEVHGGASWEEVMVPIIELTRLDHRISVTLVNNELIANYRTRPELTLFSTDDLSDVSVTLKGTRYTARKVDANRHSVVLEGVTRPGKYCAEVFEGVNLIGALDFVVRTGTGRENEML
jgi:hypothetical protein